jgi:hypothetical protein
MVVSGLGDLDHSRMPLFGGLWPVALPFGFCCCITVVTLGLSTLRAAHPFLYWWVLSGKRLSLSFRLSLLRALGATPLSKVSG